MYNNLHFAVKQRMMKELENAFQDHPAFTEKVKIYNKYPYDERVQFGVIVRNTAASQIRLSADNFMSDLYSHVRLVRQTTYPGVAIEWVRENEGFITEVVTEDVSSQVSDTLRFFYTSRPICEGPGETHYADSPGQVCVSINGVAVTPDTVDGKNGFVLLPVCPANGSTVSIRYHARNIVPPGIYRFDFISDTQFMVYPLYIIENELLIATTTGTETESQLNKTNIDPESEEITLRYKNGVRITALVRDVDYSIDYVTGLITYLQPLQRNYSIAAEYRYVIPGGDIGPITFDEYQEFHEIVPGVIVTIGRRAKMGDQQAVIVSQFREQQARIYGGHWEMSLDLSVIAKDPMQMAQMSDQVVSYLWGIRKNELEFEGLTLNRVEPTGESEEVHIETTGDMYYESSVSIDIQTEWQHFVPYVTYLKLRDIILRPDLRPVFKGPIIGYEKLT